VSNRLEEALRHNTDFRECRAAVPIDAVRYSLQRITAQQPFNYLDRNIDGNFREQFLPASVLTVDSPIYDEVSRFTNNCFVQFQTGNPKRRRQVRRIRRGEAAGIDLPGSEPCSICFSDDGALTGCEKNHTVCSSCVRSAIRIAVGDTTHLENLVCGCLTSDHHMALQRLAEKADATMQELVRSPPTDPGTKREFEVEVILLRQSFQFTDERVPAGIFARKFKEWQTTLEKHKLEPLYHACVHPGCLMENWILKTDFDTQHRARNECNWTCKNGHKNSVLPTQAEINEMNRNILMHPEYYTQRCGSDGLALRRFRMCPGCVQAGSLTFSVHAEGCKQWPGSGQGHRHTYCWNCTTKWGPGPDECSHSRICSDPGVQQIRRTKDRSGAEMLQIGFVDGQAYIRWIQKGGVCPPTKFKTSSMFTSSTTEVLGATRQGELGMEDREVLKKALQEGTS